MNYDQIAAYYDDHFDRDIDQWEDGRLTRLLKPWVNGGNVLDLGCGTGWVLDHLHPHDYLGVDASAPMLDQLLAKHPTAYTMKADIGAPGWHTHLPLGHYNRVVATWSAHDLGNLTNLLLDLSEICEPGTRVLLHGQAPRYARRQHYVLDGADEHKGYLHFTPRACRVAARHVGARWVGATGTGATPDALATTHTRWAATLRLPARLHYAFLAHWSLP